MRHRLIIVSALLGLCAAVLSRGAPPDGWKQLFDAKDTTNWEHVGPGGFTVENGLLKQ